MCVCARLPRSLTQLPILPRPVFLIAPISGALIRYNGSCLSVSPDVCHFLSSPPPVLFLPLLSLSSSTHHAKLRCKKIWQLNVAFSLSANIQTTRNIIFPEPLEAGRLVNPVWEWMDHIVSFDIKGCSCSSCDMIHRHTNQF